MTPENHPVPDDPQDEAPSLGEDVLDVSLDDGGSLDLQAFADEVAEATPEGMGNRTGNTINLDEGLEREELDVLAEVNGLQVQLTESMSQIKSLEARELEVMDQFRRLSKDFTNFRGRAARDIQMAVDQAERKLLLEFLPVLDNFERSLESSYPDLEAFRGGVDLIRKQFHDALRRGGVEKVPLEVGHPFNAHTAEALTTMARPDLPDGAVAAIYEKGYTLRDRLIRPAKVVVNHRPDDPGPGYDTVNLDAPKADQ